MKTLKFLLYPACALAFALTLPACKSKKLITKPQPVATTTQPVDKPAVAVTKPAPVPPPPPPAPDYNFSNIQFDFNSSVLRTDAIQYLDHVVAEMRKDPKSTFMLNGNASSEGTAKHNMILSADRANSVKQYLVNAGIDGSRLTPKGYGTTKPIASNDTEEGREKNRRVEVKPAI